MKKIKVDDYKHYRRFPIILGKNDIAVIHVFSRYDNLEDACWMSDNDEYFRSRYDTFKESAEQFIDQLEGAYCEAFIIALRDRCNEILKREKDDADNITDL
jgi:hypothetical protein